MEDDPISASYALPFTPRVTARSGSGSVVEGNYGNHAQLLPACTVKVPALILA
jgi:hypothetical protein